MALPTPGYNPETSLLQGGTAPIVPVQGGGGLGGAPPTPDYNPSASLLQGGTGVIEPIRGGGKEGVRFANVLEETREYSEEAAATNISRMSKAYTLEVYDIRVDAKTLAIDSDKAARQRRLLNYVNKEKQTRVVTSIGAYDAGDVYTSYPKYGDCKAGLPVNYFTERARKVHYMDDKPHMIWLIPNLRGNKQVYETIFNKLIEENYVVGTPNTVLVFTGSFYPDKPNDDSIFLFDELMKLKEKNPGRVFVISPSNATLVSNGCHILEQMYGKSSLLAEGKSRLVPTFFEPDILVFPHERFIVRSCDMPISADSKVSVGLLAKKKVFNKSYFIQPKLTIKSDPAPLVKYVTVLSNPNQSETKSWPPKAQQTIKCPKDMDCQHFEVGFPLALLGESSVLNFLDTKLYLFHITREKQPFLTGPKEEGAEEEEEEEEEEEVEVVPVEEEEEEPVVIPPKPVKVVPPKKIKGFYKESPDAKSAEKTVTFDLGEYTFTIRVPKSHTSSDPIRLDWLNEVFTKDEALLLNALQLTPALMKKAFGEMYKWRLSGFLASLTYSSCFKETSLLLASECDDARRFLRKVSYLMEKDCLESFYKNLGTPPKGEIEVAGEGAKEEPKGDDGKGDDGSKRIPTLEGLRLSLASLALDDSSPVLISGLGKGGFLMFTGRPVRCELPSGEVKKGVAQMFKDREGVRYVYFQDETGTMLEFPADQCTQLSIVPESRRERGIPMVGVTASSDPELLSDILRATGADGKELLIGSFVNCGGADSFFIYGFVDVNGEIYAVPFSDSKALLDKKVLANKCKLAPVEPPTTPSLNRLIQKAYDPPVVASSLADDLNAIAESWRNLRLEPFPENLPNLEPVPESDFLPSLTAGLAALSLPDLLPIESAKGKEEQLYQGDYVKCQVYGTPKEGYIYGFTSRDGVVYVYSSEISTTPPFTRSSWQMPVKDCIRLPDSGPRPVPSARPA